MQNGTLFSILNSNLQNYTRNSAKKLQNGQNKSTFWMFWIFFNVLHDDVGVFCWARQLLLKYVCPDIETTISFEFSLIWTHQKGAMVKTQGINHIELSRAHAINSRSEKRKSPVQYQNIGRMGMYKGTLSAHMSN